MENKHQKIWIILSISTLIFLVIIFIGITYAFFTANNPEGSTAQIISKNGRMLINYNDGTDNIQPVTGIVPSNAILVNKTFTLTGINTTVGMNSNDGLTMPYKVGVEYTSGFSDGMIHYYIKSTNKSTNVTEEYTGETNQTVPGNPTYTGYSHGTFKNGKKYTEMVTGEFPANLNEQTITFNLIIQFPDNNKNQDSEKSKTFNGKIVINYEIETMSKTISQLYQNNTKNTNGITTDGLQKDGTGAYNIKNLSTNSEKYNISLLGNESNNILADTETDSYDNIRYVGSNPNNYLKFNDETWRIIGVFHNITLVDESNNESKETLVKIVRNDSLGNYSWDSSESTINSGYGVNEWSNSKIKTELNTDYIDTNKTSGETKWYNFSNNTQNTSYDFSKNIKSNFIDKIATIKWNLGGISATSSVINTYNNERGTEHIVNPDDKITRTDTWIGKIGLIYPSDYGFASTNTSCRSSLTSTNCSKNNWLFNSNFQWTISSSTLNASNIWEIGSTGRANSSYASYSRGIRPTLYLKSDIIISSGTGKSNDPFIIE